MYMHLVQLIRGIEGHSSSQVQWYRENLNLICIKVQVSCSSVIQSLLSNFSKCKGTSSTTYIVSEVHHPMQAQSALRNHVHARPSTCLAADAIA